MIKVDLSGAAGFFDPAGPDYAAAAQAHRTLLEHTGAGADFTGWLDLPERMQSGELKQILAAASRIRGRSQALVVVGIGGSYLGAKGALELLRPRPQPGDPKILFAGNSLSPDALMHLLEELGDLDFDLNVVSKSGTTLEPALAFRMFRGLLEAKYGPEKAKKHIFATTDAHRGVLKHMADEEGWETFVVPDDVGGRYSVLSAVGLLPMAAAGIDVQTVIGEAIEAFAAMSAQSPEPRLAVCRRAPAPVPARKDDRDSRLLRAVVPFHGRVVEAALRRERGQKRHRHLPRLRGIQRRPALHGSVYSGRPAHAHGDRRLIRAAAK